jgi:sporulation protein YlmC with PRC-barrel domain
MAGMALAAPTIAATPVTPVTTAAPAQQCLTDLGAFDATLRKDGYWIDGAGYGYGYPVYGYGYSYGGRYSESAGYGRARPGYEVRTMLATARILAQRGEQQPCESVLHATRDAYASYVSELRKGQIPPADVPTWRREQIETAVPVTADGGVYRSDQLIGSSIVNAKNENLGTVEDIVMSPTTGKIAYLVVGHGGFWGIEEKYSPVPWSDFKSAAGNNLLVLTVTKVALDAAPQVPRDASDGSAAFAAQSHKVDTYWAAHPPVAMN